MCQNDNISTRQVLKCVEIAIVLLTCHFQLIISYHIIIVFQNLKTSFLFPAIVPCVLNLYTAIYIIHGVVAAQLLHAPPPISRCFPRWQGVNPAVSLLFSLVTPCIWLKSLWCIRVTFTSPLYTHVRYENWVMPLTAHRRLNASPNPLLKPLEYSLI